MKELTCGYREEFGNPLEDVPVSYGPLCGKQVTHISCVPFTKTLTCAEHKCRCATPIENEGLPLGWFGVTHPDD